ncbi:unnamed protein product [Calypogeia fissa]
MLISDCGAVRRSPERSLSASRSAAPVLFKKSCSSRTDHRMGRPVVTIEVGEGVAVITIFNPQVNSVSQDVMMGVYASFKEAHNRNDVKAIVLTVWRSGCTVFRWSGHWGNAQEKGNRFRSQQ